MQSKRVQKILKSIEEKTEMQKEISRKAIGYVRVSTEEQATGGYSIEFQEEAIRNFAKNQNFELVEVVCDVGISGATDPQKRKGFIKVLKLAEKWEMSTIIVWKFDRLSRSLYHSVIITNNLLEGYGIDIKSVTEPIDTSNPIGQTFLALFAGLAAQERKSITERTIAGKIKKAQQGGFAGGTVPIGYKKDKDGKLMVDEKEAQIVRRIYYLRKEGKSLREIAKILEQENILPKKAERWSAETIRYILDNNKYKGFVEYLFKWGKREYIVQKGMHLAIIV